MATALLSVPTSHRNPVSQIQLPCTSNKFWFHASVTSIKYPYKPPILLCSPSSSVSVVEDEPSPPPPDAVRVQPDSSTQQPDKTPFRGCKACGKEELERGCNGEGRIQGGIATVPGFGWWPIKAYRPCPGFVATGGRYRRQGQSMDEVAFGRGVPRTPMSPSDDDNPSKKQGGKKFKK